ncbi:hypothetical protein PoB_001212500, partial [Plakobranchus ocellatus]
VKDHHSLPAAFVSLCLMRSGALRCSPNCTTIHAWQICRRALRRHQDTLSGIILSQKLNPENKKSRNT